MGIHISKFSGEEEMQEPSTTIKRYSNSQIIKEVFYFQLKKYEFPPNPQFSRRLYEEHLSKDFTIVLQEFNQYHNNKNH